jgi:hypothetical protein
MSSKQQQVEQSHSDIWKSHVKIAEESSNAEDAEAAFNDALHACPKERRSYIHTRRGDYYFYRRNLEAAAIAYSQSNLGFEEVVLKLLNSRSIIAAKRSTQDDVFEVNQLEAEDIPGVFNPRQSNSLKFLPLPLTTGPELSAVRRYLEELLCFLPLTSKSQRTIVCTWLCELFVHEIASCTLDKTRNINPDVMNRFQSFLRTHKSSLDPATTMQLISSRDVRPLVVFYAQLVGDYEKVVYFYLDDRRYSDVIALLTDAPFEKVEVLIYQAGPLLMAQEPEAAVALFLSKPKLELSRILPSLLRYCDLVDASDANDASLETDYEGRHVNFAVLYVQDCLASCGYSESETSRKRELIQLCIFLLAKYDNPSEEQLLQLLQPVLDDLPAEMDDEDCLVEAHISRSRPDMSLVVDPISDQIPFDVNYALNICSHYSRHRSVVILLALSGSNEEAVVLAAAVDMTLAKKVVMRPTNVAVRRRLWNVLIQESLKGSSETSRNIDIVHLLRESEGVLQVEDIMKYLSQTNDMDVFRDEICHALESFGEKIEGLQAEMEELAASAESIVTELEATKKRGYGFSTHQRCEYCGDAVFSKQFYIFPCGHGFHCDCIMKRLSE